MAASKILNLKSKALKKTRKREDKKRELADHTLSTLAQLGYARTSLRDIAEQSGVSVGVLHYYFEDKVDLISYCVERYIDQFIGHLFVIQTQSDSPKIIINEFVERMVVEIEQEADIHRLWYDIRSQALFDQNFQKVTQKIEHAIIELVSAFLRRLDAGAIDPISVYVMYDGIFRYYLQRKLMTNEDIADEFRAQLQRLFEFVGFAVKSGQNDS